MQVQALPPVFYQGGSTPAEAPGYAESCQLAAAAFQLAVDAQPDEWVLHLYLGKACALSLEIQVHSSVVGVVNQHSPLDCGISMTQQYICPLDREAEISPKAEHIL